MALVGILGASGYLGNEVYLFLKKSDEHRVVGYSRGCVGFIGFDYCDLSELEHLDIIINCAGPNSKQCEHDNQLAFDYYHAFQNKLLDHCLKHSITLITFSTVHVYRKTPIMINEDSETTGYSAYTRYRLNFEDRVNNLANKDIILLRLGNCFGKSNSKSSENETLFINSIAHALRRDEQFTVKSRIDFSRNYVPICYLLRVLLQLIDQGRSKRSIINVLGSGPLLASEIIDKFHARYPSGSIEYQFDSQEKPMSFSNALCSNIVSYSENFFLEEMDRLLS